MMAQPPDSQHRRAMRRAVDIPCELVSRHVDSPLLYWATDLTPYGMWVETPIPMQIGEVVVVCFRPPVWWPGRELMVFSEVTRVANQARGRHGPRGMGVEFLDLPAHERRTLVSWLRRRPPPLPLRRARSGRDPATLPQPLYLKAC